PPPAERALASPVGPAAPRDRRRPGQSRGELAHTIQLLRVTGARREALGNAHALLDGRAVTEHREGFRRVQDAIERALLPGAEERDPVRLARPGRRVARQPGKDTQTERCVGDGEEPEPAGMAESGRVGLPPRANRLARVVALERLVHGLDVCGPRAERLDLSEQGPYHHRTSVIEASSV